MTKIQLLALAGLGCGNNEYGMSDLFVPNEETPVLSIEPNEVFFDDTHTDEQSVEWLTLTSAGGAAVEVDALRVEGPAIFMVEDDDFHLMLHPGESYELPVYFAPGDDLDLPAFHDPGGDVESATLHISSNDADGPWHLVPLHGAGMYPHLVVQPNPYDYGKVYLDCGWEKTFTLGNTGQVELIIEEIAASLGDFDITQGPTLPIELEPGETAELTMLFAPTSPGNVENELLFTTNEPRGSDEFTQSAEGSDENFIVDTWRQPDGAWEMSDILFYVDTSGSMGDDHKNLVSNFSQFTELLDDVLNDYQIMIVTEDSGCHNMDVITPATSDPFSIFQSAIYNGGGALKEAGLSSARNALQQTGSGQCNQGFGREGAKVMPVLISDEPEQSSATWSQLTAEIVALEPNASISAIAGPVPVGCRTASPGTGYYEASWATGGLFISICEPDWGNHLQELAILATAEPHKTFFLSSQPVDKETIAVTVDFVENGDWSYDEAENAVRFPAELVPEPLSWVEISYYLECDD